MLFGNQSFSHCHVLPMAVLPWMILWHQHDVALLTVKESRMKWGIVLERPEQCGDRNIKHMTEMFEVQLQ